MNLPINLVNRYIFSICTIDTNEEKKFSVLRICYEIGHIDIVEIPLNVESINLSKNRIREISPNTFNNELRCLDLSQNILHIDKCAFPQNLEILCLNRNPITKIVKNIFPYHLKELYLRNCGIIYIEKKSLPSTLCILDISENKINVIHTEMLPNKLYCLIAEDSEIEKIEPHALPPSLVSLALHFNYFANLDFCKDLPNIQYLDVRKCIHITNTACQAVLDCPKNITIKY